METTLTPESIELFLKSLRGKGRSGNTIRAYEADLTGLLRWIPTSRYATATLEDQAAGYLNETREAAAPKTTKRRLASFRQYGKFHGLLLLPEYTPPKPAKQEAHPIPEGISAIRQMIEVAEESWERVLVTGIGLLGMRVSEARTLTHGNFDLSQGVGNITLTIRGKGDKERTIPVSQEAWANIEPRFIESLKNGERIVPVSDSTARDRFTKLGQAVGLSRRVSSHDGRATLATHALNQGANIRVVQEILGHASVETTQLYTGVTMDQMRKAVTL